MKSLIILLFATTVVVAQNVNQTDVPSAITTNFQKEYSKATNVEWEITSLNYLGKVLNEMAD